MGSFQAVVVVVDVVENKVVFSSDKISFMANAEN